MSIVEQLDVFDDHEHRDAAMQMAIDEIMLRVATRPTLRLYRWRAPAISFGYFSRFADVNGEAAERELVRRWTGGGIVFHDADLTYALAIPRTDRLFAQSSADIYRAIHGAVASALQRNGTTATLATLARARVSDVCFANPVAADVVVDGKKIAGAAQRRSRFGLLQQGSIQLPQLPPEFALEFARNICREFQWREIPDALIAAARELADAKYATGAWLMRR